MQFVYLWDFRSFSPSLCTHNRKHFHHPIVASNKSSTVMCIHLLYGYRREDAEKLSNIWNAGGDTEWRKQVAQNPYHNYCKYFLLLLFLPAVHWWMSKTCGVKKFTQRGGKEGEKFFDCSLFIALSNWNLTLCKYLKCCWRLCKSQSNNASSVLRLRQRMKLNFHLNVTSHLS